MTPPPDTGPRAVFLALEVPDAVRRAVVGMLGALPDDVDAAWTRPEGWHVTLAWLDRLDDAGVAHVRGIVDRVLDELAAGVDEEDPRDATSGDAATPDPTTGDATPPVDAGSRSHLAVTLGDTVRIRRAVALGGRASPALRAMQHRMTTALADGLGDALSGRARGALGRPWRPHVTLARSRRGGDPARVQAVIASRWSGPVSWTPDGLALLASHVGAGPARYVARHRWRFPT